MSRRQRDTLSEAVVSSRTLVTSLLEINHVTNVTKVLNETTASDRVSRYVMEAYHV